MGFNFCSLSPPPSLRGPAGGFSPQQRIPVEGGEGSPERPGPTMTSKEEPKPSSGEERRRSPLDHLPPPANSNKPLTPFSIEDILNKPSVRRSYTLCGTAHLLSAAEKHPPAGLPLSGRALLSQTSPLCALEELASKTFKGLEVSVLQAAEGKPLARWGGSSLGWVSCSSTRGPFVFPPTLPISRAVARGGMGDPRAASSTRGPRGAGWVALPRSTL